jgi:hypothetical protein
VPIAGLSEGTRDQLYLALRLAALGEFAARADPVKEFLASCYSGTVAGNPWTVSGRLEIARRGWALYARNEMLSLAWLTLALTMA